MRRLLGMQMVVAVFTMAVSAFGAGLPDVSSDFIASVYVESSTNSVLYYPEMISFGPGGVTYVGNGANPGGYLYRIASGGGTGSVDQFGENWSLYDPDTVVYDSVGFLGSPGRVITGGEGYICAVTLDESERNVLWTEPVANPSDMVFDSQGRLLITDVGSTYVYTAESVSSPPSVLINVENTYAQNIATAGNNIYISCPMDGTIRAYDLEGGSLRYIAQGLNTGVPIPIAVSVGGNWPDGIYTISNQTFRRYEFDGGSVTTLGTGFTNNEYVDMEFYNGELYITEGLANRILKITYKPSYGFTGLFSPYEPPPTAFKVNSNIPLKWQYTDESGTPVDTSADQPYVQIALLEEGDWPTEGSTIALSTAGSSGYQYDTATDTWQFNWKTRGLAAGIYGIRIVNPCTQQIDPDPSTQPTGFEIQLNTR